jgi:hypothetical protein
VVGRYQTNDESDTTSKIKNEVVKKESKQRNPTEKVG